MLNMEQIILKMDPQVQDGLIRHSIHTGHQDQLQRLIEIIGTTRDPAQLDQLVQAERALLG